MFKKIVLDNGLRIIFVPKEDSLAVTVLILVEAGSKYETKDINGLSHFLEHMCFKGTKKRPRPIDIASELAGIGAASNAHTSLELTGYYAKAEPTHFNAIFDIVSDIYLNPVFDPQEIDKERGVIIEEINMIMDTPMRYIGHLWHELLYGDQPAGWDVIGRPEIIRRISREDFLDYRKNHYLPNATVVVVAGKFNEDEVLSQIKEKFSPLPSGDKLEKVKTEETQESPRILLKTKQTDQSHLILGVRAFDIFDKRKYALEVLADILGGGMSSRLFQKIREEMGAAYYVFAGADLFTDHGYLAVQAGVDQKRIDLIIEAIMEELIKMTAKPVGEKELHKSKEHLVGTTMLALETSDALAEFYGEQELIKKELITPEEFARKIRAITVEEIQKVAQDIFRNRGLNLAVIGAPGEKINLERVLRFN